MRVRHVNHTTWSFLRRGRVINNRDMMEKPHQSNIDLKDPFLSLKPHVQTLGCAWAISEFWHNEMQQLQIILASTHAVMQCASPRFLLHASTHRRTVWVSQEAEKHQFQQSCMIKGALEGWKRSRIPLSQRWLSLQLWQISSAVLICNAEILLTYHTGEHRTNYQRQPKTQPQKLLHQEIK